MKLIAKLTSILLIATSFAYGSRDVQDLRFNNIRQMSMGNAVVASPRDDNALYQNPAGLVNLKRFHLKFPRLNVAVNEDIFDNQSYVNDFICSIDSDCDSDQDGFQILEDLVKDGPVDLRFQAYLSPALSLSWPGFAVGLYAATNTLVRIQDPNEVTMIIEQTMDTAPMVGYGRYVTMFGNKVAVGVSAKQITRTTAYDPETGRDRVVYDSSELTEFFDDSENVDFVINTYTQKGLAFDFGLLAPVNALGDGGGIGFTLRNIGGNLQGTKILEDDIEEKVNNQLPLIGTFGISMRPKVPVIGKINFAADMDVISDETSFFKRLYLGGEKNILGDFLHLRGGVNQGYIVGGFGFNFKILHVDYAFYAEELGDEIGDNGSLSHAIQFGLLF